MTPQMLEKTRNQRVKIDMSEVHKILLKLGIMPKLLGYSYIISAIELIFFDPSYLRAITKALYVELAGIYQTTPICVERNIRNAITSAWSHGDREYIQNIFYNSVDPEKGCPTNSQFLSVIYYTLKLRDR